ncbi:MAG: hypothetical protein MMC23_009414 [Stictis urceolatum]|nr:hypothetical protein [Stictis urceolata]
MLNHLTTPDEHTVLGSDSFTGAVWRIDTRPGEHLNIITHPMMSRHSYTQRRSPIGVNGLQIRRHGRKTYLYFTNTAKSLLARFEINRDWTPKGKAVQLAATTWLGPSHGNTIWRTDLDGNNQELIAGDANSTSAAAFGRTKMDRNVLFVLTAGGLGEMGRVPVVGGQILALNAR